MTHQIPLREITTFPSLENDQVSLNVFLIGAPIIKRFCQVKEARGEACEIKLLILQAMF